MTARILWLLCLAFQLALAAVLYGGDTVPMPRDGRDPLVSTRVKRDVPRGILLYREVYDYNGKRIAIEESSDAPKRTAPKTTPQPKAQARAEAAPEYKWINGHWYKANGDWWTYCKQCEGLPGPNGEPAKAARSVPSQRPFSQSSIPTTSATSAGRFSTSYRGLTRTARTTTFAPAAAIGGSIKLGGG